ncbi:MAG: nitroreductase family protein [Candidatus Acidiferrum sp.]
MGDALEVIFGRRAVKVFEPVEIPGEVREQILNAARVAPSSFNSQPYRLYWLETPEIKKAAAKLCMGQSPAETASALVVAVADIGCWRMTTELQLEWMRASGVNEKELQEYQSKSKFAKLFFTQGWFGVLGGVKWAILRVVHLWKIIGMAPISREELFKWAVKSTSLACQNLMIASEALGLNTCPMEGFDGRRLGKLLGLSRRHHEIVMVIAVGKKSTKHVDRPQWRRPLTTTVTVL